MANLIMTNWYIKDKTPYIVIGTAGENNATSISIECDEIIENAEYFLDIGDSKNDIFNTQELTVKQQITPTGETTNILYLKPMRSFLGKEGVKLLQVRCEYIDNDEKVTKESNVFHAVVNKNTGFSYKFDIAIFQQYLNKVKELAAKIAQAISNMTLEELKDTNIVDPTDGQIIKYDAETQKWINGEGGGSGGSSNYNELSNKPKINNVVLSGNKTTSDLGINIPTKTSDLTNDSNFVADANYVHTDNNYTNADKAIVDGVTSALASKANSSDLASVATSGDYDDLINKPFIPSVSVTQVLESGTKIAEINVDGTTTNIFAPNSGSGSSTLSGLTDVNLSSPTNEQVLTYDATSSKWVNALAKKEIVQIAEEDIPEPPNIEDKIYELHGEDFEDDTTMYFPPSTATPKEIDDYFSDWGYRAWRPEDNGFRWTVSDKFRTITFEHNNSTYIMREISYRFSNPNTYRVSAALVSDNSVSNINMSAGTELNVRIVDKNCYYLLGDSENQIYLDILDRETFDRVINSKRIEDLQDVNITNPLQNNSVLAYDSATNRWKNKPMTSVSVTQTLSSGTKIGSISVDGNETDLFAPSGSGGATSLSGLSDVDINRSVADSDGQALRYNTTTQKWQNMPISRFMDYIDTAVTEYTLTPDTTVFFTTPLAELDVTLTNSGYAYLVNEFHFMFLSGSTPTELSLPENVTVPDDFSVEANKVYEISIMNRLMLYTSWALPEQEEPEES